eukprot:TRINITY_DN3941_c0_g1_i1.p2 TRINITY_DN3941_c0_g1~~TRINITY_DN3941_c0_g1_i1.p2  ORF type:complete len:140 (+),score=31.80 TRINITY_DN3941_c0_g1_i1:52-471(+)
MMKDSFTPLFDESNSGKPRVRTAGYQSQAQKNKDNRMANAQAGDKPHHHHPTHEIDLFIEHGTDGHLDPTRGTARARQHFQAIDDNVEEVEKRMLADAPKQADPTLPDVFDQSWKEMADKSLLQGSIAAQSAKDDEFDF